jgi:membrane protease subunit HflC
MKGAVVVAGVVVAGLALAILSSALYTVAETEQALVVRLGKPMGTAGGPGLKVKLPLVDMVFYYDTRLLALEPPTEQVILGDQKRIEVQAYTLFRIVDPLRFYQSVRTVELARAQLTQIISSSVRRELGRVALPQLLSEDRARITEEIRQKVYENALPLGIEVADVRFRRADLPLEASQAIYDRMKSERQREAKELRAQGFEWAQQIKSKADRDRTVILAEAERDSRIMRGQGDAEASRVFADAFASDPQFYKLYRVLQTYRHALAEANPILVLSPDAIFLRDFNTGPGGTPPRP